MKDIKEMKQFKVVFEERRSWTYLVIAKDQDEAETLASKVYYDDEDIDGRCEGSDSEKGRAVIELEKEEPEGNDLIDCEEIDKGYLIGMEIKVYHKEHFPTPCFVNVLLEDAKGLFDDEKVYHHINREDLNSIKRWGIVPLDEDMLVVDIGEKIYSNGKTEEDKE